MEKILTKNTLIEGIVQPIGTRIVIEEARGKLNLVVDAPKSKVNKVINKYYKDLPHNNVTDTNSGKVSVSLEGDEDLLDKIKKELANISESVEGDSKIEEAFNSNADIENLVYEVQDLTDRNNHTEARLLVAEEFGMTKYYDLFTKIKEIQDLEGYLPNDVATYRYQLTNSMLEIIEKLSGKETRDAVYNAM